MEETSGCTEGVVINSGSSLQLTVSDGTGPGRASFLYLLGRMRLRPEEG